MARLSLSRPSVLVVNERLKSLSGLLFNLGGGLAAASVVKVYQDGLIDASVLLWSFAAVMLIFLGWLTLSLLEQQQDEHADVR